MHEFIGWIGALLYVIAYFWLSINKRADNYLTSS